jgi:hypothetical protein
MDSIGICAVCGQSVAFGDSFIDTRPSDWNDPTKVSESRWVPVGTDIHGWSPFVLTHPVCWLEQYSPEDLVRLVDESHRLLRAMLAR